MFSFLQAFLNNFVTFIKFASNKLIYDFRVRNTLRLLTDLFIKDLNYLRLIKRKEIDDVIIFINAMIKNRYDNNHIIIKLET